MLSGTLSFWFLGIIFFELQAVELAVQGAALSLILVLGIISLILSCELDAFAALLLSIYTGIFLFLALLLLHFGPYHQRAQTNAQTAARQHAGVCGVGWGFLCVTGVSGLAVVGGTPAWLMCWQDLQYLGSAGPVLGNVPLNWLFYRLYFLETGLINIYLLLALALAVAILLVLRATPANSVTWRAEQAVGATSTLNLRFRVVAKQRRQARRRNSGTVRYRV